MTVYFNETVYNLKWFLRKIFPFNLYVLHLSRNHFYIFTVLVSVFSLLAMSFLYTLVYWRRLLCQLNFPDQIPLYVSWPSLVVVSSSSFSLIMMVIIITSKRHQFSLSGSSMLSLLLDSAEFVPCLGRSIWTVVITEVKVTSLVALGWRV